LPLLAVGIAGAIVAFANREVDSAFEFRARNPLQVEPVQVEEAVLNAPEPVPEKKTEAERARCRSRGKGDLRNPWTCTVRYGSGRAFTYTVEVDADGSFRGQNDIGDRIISGCCVRGG
jgi:hypothetical protein